MNQVEHLWFRLLYRHQLDSNMISSFAYYFRMEFIKTKKVWIPHIRILIFRQRQFVAFLALNWQIIQTVKPFGFKKLMVYAIWTVRTMTRIDIRFSCHVIFQKQNCKANYRFRKCMEKICFDQFCQNGPRHELAY